jgi:ubiquinone/menaquinone biosynthesis C-methylase UbiE
MADEELDFTGEQVVKGTTPDRIWQDHIARYRHAAPRLGGAKVLDVACGTGYGAAEVAKVASSVEGVDISPEVVAHASKTYKSPNLRFRAGSLLDLPFPDGHFDAVTCFETIEHVDDAEKALSELRRVVRPGGQVFLSTPNRIVTSPLKGLHDKPNNKYHVREWTVPEFTLLVKPYFPILRRLGQRARPRVLFVPRVYRRMKKKRPQLYKPELGRAEPEPLRWWTAHRYVVFECTRP